MNKKILKERKKKMNNSKGITLVALIITIVVLLILAVVAIGVVRDSNIIRYAQNAAGGYNQAKNNETSEITKAEELLNKYSSTLKENPWIDEVGLSTLVKYDQIYAAEVTIDGTTAELEYVFKSSGELQQTFSGTEDTLPKDEMLNMVTPISQDTFLLNETKFVFVDSYNALEIYDGNDLMCTLTFKVTTADTDYYGFYWSFESTPGAGLGTYLTDKQYRFTNSNSEADEYPGIYSNFWCQVGSAADLDSNVGIATMPMILEEEYTATFEDGTTQTFENALFCSYEAADWDYILFGYIKYENNQYKLVILNSDYDGGDNLDENRKPIKYNSITEVGTVTKDSTPPTITGIEETN